MGKFQIMVVGVSNHRQPAYPPPSPPPHSLLKNVVSFLFSLQRVISVSRQRCFFLFSIMLSIIIWCLFSYSISFCNNSKFCNVRCKEQFNDHAILLSKRIERILLNVPLHKKFQRQKEGDLHTIYVNLTFTHFTCHIFAQV